MGGSLPIVPVSAFWGTILGSVFSRATTQQLWGALRGAASASGVTLAPGAFLQVSALRSLAVQQRSAMESFAAMAPGQAITSSEIAPAVDANLQGIALRGANYRVAWQQVITAPDGSLTTRWNTTVYTEGLPTTWDALQADLELQGEELAASSDERYAGIHVGIGGVSITEF